MINFHLGDCVQWAREYEGEPFHALLCDAPYEMAFMNRGWDSSGVAFDPDTWRALARVLHPGAFLFVFAGTINDDLISVAMREAGLRKFHKMMGWSYGSGFPKASNIAKQLDGKLGAQSKGFSAAGDDGRKAELKQDLSFRSDYGYKYEPATPLAQAFAGHRYGLQALKPAIETVLIFQKPYAGRPIDSIVETGAGCLWVDGGRIGVDEDDPNIRRATGENGGSDSMFGVGNTKRPATLTQGRWPSNFYLGDAEAARRLDEQSGERGGGYGVVGAKGSRSGGIMGKHTETRKDAGNICGYGDTGGASRFFFRVEEQIDAADPVRYVAKASRRERDAGLDGMEVKRVPRGSSNNLKQWENGERAFDELDEKSKAFATELRNPHPTVKPLALTRYLATLLLPPAEYAPRRLLVPFAGVGSECIGAMQAGWEYVQGVEITPEYIPIAEARAAYWTEKEAQAQMVLPL